MFCPNCGQQQISEEMRFCSRCGLSLIGLAEWMAGGGVPKKRRDEAPVSPLSPRRKGIRRAAKLMFFSGVSFFVFLALSLAVNEGAPMIFPFILFFVSLVLMLYARLFSDPTAPVNYNAAAVTSALRSNSTRGSLPAAEGTPVPDVGRQRVRTNELAQPPSVTENTTRFLDE